MVIVDAGWLVMTSPGLLPSRHPQSPASQEALITDHASGLAYTGQFSCRLLADSGQIPGG